MKSYNWQPGRACTEALVLNHSNMAESATSDRRIWFLENPWPKGHKITEFRWCATLKEGDTGQPKEVWLNLSLETEEYNAADPEIDEASAYDNIDDDVPVWICRQDWMCYRSCGVNRDGGRGFRLCTQEQYNPDFLDGLEVEVDMQRDLDDPEDQEIAAFTIFVLGHDAVGCNRFRFERMADSNKFKILWSGKIALTYRGESDFSQDFRAVIGNLRLPRLKK